MSAGKDEKVKINLYFMLSFGSKDVGFDIVVKIQAVTYAILHPDCTAMTHSASYRLGSERHIAFYLFIFFNSFVEQL